MNNLEELSPTDIKRLLAAAEQHDERGSIVAKMVKRLIAQLEAVQRELGDLLNQEFQQRLANAEHQLYMKDLAIHNIKASRMAQFRKRLAAEKELTEWRSVAEAAAQDDADWHKLADRNTDLICKMMNVLITTGERANKAEAALSAENQKLTLSLPENCHVDKCRTFAWEAVKDAVGHDNWTVGDASTYFGFYCWGWDMRRQYDEQVIAKQPAGLVEGNADAE
ncbi:hypothetical protein PGS49_16040 [Yersinia intermedia]|uniref:hypothetical protein n=1 Tax=Yersinia intermedia TaxID=631 RepID=UPI0022FEB942|nr:hypothetical protein [Yersinia intermedia]MDA5482157.1 hypothetical protein [Yersinia intermedia]